MCKNPRLIGPVSAFGGPQAPRLEAQVPPSPASFSPSHGNDLRESEEVSRDECASSALGKGGKQTMNAEGQHEAEWETAMGVYRWLKCHSGDDRKGAAPYLLGSQPEGGTSGSRCLDKGLIRRPEMGQGCGWASQSLAHL